MCIFSIIGVDAGFLLTLYFLYKFLRFDWSDVNLRAEDIRVRCDMPELT